MLIDWAGTLKVLVDVYLLHHCIHPWYARSNLLQLAGDSFALNSAFALHPGECSRVRAVRAAPACEEWFLFPRFNYL